MNSFLKVPNGDSFDSHEFRSLGSTENILSVTSVSNMSIKELKSSKCTNKKKVQKYPNKANEKLGKI